MFWAFVVNNHVLGLRCEQPCFGPSLLTARWAELGGPSLAPGALHDQ
jgi:hypothetical protein